MNTHRATGIALTKTLLQTKTKTKTKKNKYVKAI